MSTLRLVSQVGTLNHNSGRIMAGRFQQVLPGQWPVSGAGAAITVITSRYRLEPRVISPVTVLVNSQAWAKRTGVCLTSLTLEHLNRAGAGEGRDQNICLSASIMSVRNCYGGERRADGSLDI